MAPTSWPPSSPARLCSLEKNENWYGWTDGKHVYVDPTDGQTYPMYQTTAIDCQQIEEASTNKMMFLKGELMGYGLTADDFATYRNSEFCHRTPKETLFFLILNGNKSVLDDREAAADFDTATKDLQTMTLTSFRKAVAVTYDKELFASYHFSRPFRRLRHHRQHLYLQPRDRRHLPQLRAGQAGPVRLLLRGYQQVRQLG